MKFTFENPLIQGDVILKRLAELPTDASLTKADVKVLQSSEITGHHHQFRGNAAVDLYNVAFAQEPGVDTITANEGKIIVVKEPSVLFHGREFDDTPAARGVGDHNSLTVPPGVYFVDIAREYNYDLNEEMRVVD